MKNLFLFLASMLLLAGCAGNQQQDTQQELRFHDGKFRIAQFTDIHWGNEGCQKAEISKMILNAAQTEKPDLLMLTGDIVTNGDPQTGWQEMVEMLEKTGIPYVITMGNHDPEVTTVDSIYNFLREKAPHHIGEAGPSDIHGCGNGFLEIKGSDTDSTRAVVWYIDSGDYYKNEKISYYDYIHRDQIAWYIEESSKLTAKNQGKPIPAVAFFHICTPEYAYVANDTIMRYGNFGEKICPAEINSGFLAAVHDQGDIMATFVGHDHTNDFIGLWKELALAYGRQSGVAGNDPEAPMGCRIIELKEGCRMFDTWIWTPKGEEAVYYYPSGFNSDMDKDMNFFPAADVNEEDLEQGVDYIYYEGAEGMKSLNVMLRPENKKGEGILKNLDISQAPAEDHFGYEFSGFFKAEKRSVYVISLSSDDGSRLYLDGQLIIDNDGSHSAEMIDCRVALEKGMHNLKVEYFENYMGQNLSVYITTREHKYLPLQDSQLWRRK